MNCIKCGKENHKNSKFCRFCGEKISKNKHIKVPISPRALFISFALFAIFCYAAYTTPKIFDYFSVENALAQARAFESNGQYQQALDTLTAVTKKWTTKTTRNDISLLQQKEQKYIGWENDYNTALTDIASSSYNEAQILLQGIDPSYPQYSVVKSKLVEVQKAIQDDLNAKITAAQQDTKTAQQNAAAQKAAAAAAKQKADTAEKNAAFTASLASASTARTAFVNQLRNINANFVNNCSGNLVKAVNAYSSGQNSGVYVGAAVSACDSAETDAKNLDNSYSSMPSDYVSAVHAMEWAAHYYTQSVLAFTQQSYQTALNNINAADPYEKEVESFLQNH